MGGPGSLATIQKGPVHQVIDDLVNRRNSSRQALLNDLKTLLPADDDHTTAYLEVIKRHIPGLASIFLDYLHDIWYSPRDASPPPRPLRLNPIRPAFWPAQYHPTEPIIRKGLIKALELAIAQDCNLESYWIAAGERFETVVIQSAQQITRLIITPPTPPPWPASISNSADIWVAKRGEVLPTVERVEDDSGPVIITRLHTSTPLW